MWKNLNQQDIKNLMEVNKLLKNALNSLEDYIEIIDPTGTIIVSSTGFEKIDGFDRKSIIGRDIREVYDLDDQNCQMLASIREKAPKKNYYMKYFSRNGNYVHVMMDIFPVFPEGNSNKEPIGSIAITRDNSKIQELSSKLIDLQRELLTVKSKKKSGTRYTFDDILGQSRAINTLRIAARKISYSDSRVLILGETGTGKEMIAQSIHNQSIRAHNPFVAINCSAIPETLLESIFFGTAKGSYTGAEDKSGLFEEAGNGTLFLDEINSMSLPLQAKLLRVLEDQTFRRTGSNKATPFNARVISAMNLNPDEAIEKGQLRSDLFYRLAAVTLECPPLREREEDLDQLLMSFIDQYNRLLGKNIKTLSLEASDILHSHSWPGNIRELRHTIEHAMNLAEATDTKLSAMYLPHHLKKHINNVKMIPQITHDTDLKMLLTQYEKEIVIQSLKKNNGNINKTAKHLNVSRQNLFYRIKRLNINISHHNPEIT
ncbi:PAS domain S-box [Desulfosporosinus orientis DSM 765]|uniref:PAS domain S-box n=1 Tax=Desulfosporosinus orientis (strain ATCC 19365 / DSM 765 / NCIMB 8382 / VKM B-1628 / Singapore I) TaxID=768706 RepID=G7WAP1_DESOD|nr:sigma 54-interacting transcriptional regulator [Desulfosporosinus orientis]AET66809.1 PAS domain S-box [Desulfosporosinus orientis DSM 765]